MRGRMAGAGFLHTGVQPEAPGRASRGCYATHSTPGSAVSSWVPRECSLPWRLGPSTSHTSHRQWLQVPRPAQGAHRSQLVSEDPCGTTPKGAAASTHPSTKRHCTPDRVTPPPHCPEVLLCPTFLLCPLVCRVPCPGGPAGGAAFAR